MEPIVIVALVVTVIALIVGVVIWSSRGTESGVDEVPQDLRVKLGRTRSALGGRLGTLLARGGLDDGFWDGMEEALIAADLGVGTAAAVIEDTRNQRPNDGPAARAALEDSLIGVMADKDRSLHLVGTPAVVLVVGVNGTGKTTSIAKLAGRLRGEGTSVVLAAADTYRAAADEQLRTWADRVGVDVVTGETGSDPAAVAFEAYRTAVADGHDAVLVDTAGRLHSKTNLMEELAKVARVMEREAGEIGEVLLVIDGTTGQNAIAQAEAFTDAVGVTGIVMTKLDGTARGGIAVAVEQDLGIPVKFIGVGEGVDDLIPFDPAQFVEALLEP